MRASPWTRSQQPRFRRSRFRRSRFRRLIPVALVLVIMVQILFPVSGVFAAPTNGGDSDLQASVSQQLALLNEKMPTLITQPQLGSVGGEWAIIALARSKAAVPSGYFQGYLNRVGAELEESDGILHPTKYTEYSRLILALTAIGTNVTNVAGYNLLTYLADYDSVIKQGINGPIFALIALDSANYELPVVPAATTQATRQLYIEYILEKECTDAAGNKGGFALSGEDAQIDITAMALQALSAYAHQPAVSAAVQRGLSTLERLDQTDSGAFLWNEASAESAAQTVIAKAALGIDAKSDIQRLFDHLAAGGVGFSHEKNGEINLMATEQGHLALAAYDRYARDLPSLYRMTDVDAAGSEAGNAGNGGTLGGGVNGSGSNGEISVVLQGRKLDFAQNPINVNGRVLVPMRAIFEALGAEVTWDNATKTASGRTAAHQVSLSIGHTDAIVDGVTIQLDVPAQLVNNHTLVPVRFVAEGLDADVRWDQTSKTVYISQ